MVLTVASRPPSLMNMYSSAWARNILRKTPRSRLSSSAQTRAALPRPYTFHIGASWAGKGGDDSKMIKTAFPPDSPIGVWRDKTLSRQKAARGLDAGEDFFFVQEVIIT